MQELVFHVFAQSGDELESLLKERLLWLQGVRA
jgi:hypothetical protein